jgi:flagellar hook assembly protein FlgD
VVVTDVRQPSSSPTVYEIIQAYPNPFNPSTTLRVRLPHSVESKDVTLTIYNILGQTVRSFDVTELTDRQERNIVWDGRDLHGTPVSSGVYLAVVTTPQKRFTVKLLLMK